MSHGIGGVCNPTAAMMAIPDEERSGAWRAASAFMWRGRHPHTRNRGAPFFDLWRQTAFSGDLTIGGQGWDSSDGEDSYEPWSPGDGGKRGDHFIKGQVLDGNGTPQTGVAILGFRTSDNLYVGRTTSDSNGTYMLATPYPGVAHFVIAYLDGAPDQAGTTVNDLIPTAS